VRQEVSVEQFSGRIGVVTGGGTGMGRELVRLLASEGCHVATCDVSSDALAETERLARQGAPEGTQVLTHVADVSSQAAMDGFAAAVANGLVTTSVHLLFNNAGIAGGGSFVADDREEWERTFNVDFFGVYHSTRAFLPLLLAADEGHVVNTSSVNGLWASVGPTVPHTAYCAAKFGVRGFTEALMTDFAVNAPHLHASVVLPGHVGTSIILNSATAHDRDPETMVPAQLDRVRQQIAGMGVPVDGVSDEDLRKGLQLLGESFRDAAPTTATEAAAIIVQGVKDGRWRILVGDDAAAIDEMVRADPEHAYEPPFFDQLRARGHLGGFGL
jgi:NAD(P)-dependent dehydrogenase (short-subunit alcohol dehydrogenase family)